MTLSGMCAALSRSLYPSFFFIALAIHRAHRQKFSPLVGTKEPLRTGVSSVSVVAVSLLTVAQASGGSAEVARSRGQRLEHGLRFSTCLVRRADISRKRHPTNAQLRAGEARTVLAEHRLEKTKKAYITQQRRFRH